MCCDRALRYRAAMKRSKLVLNREIVRELTSIDLVRVAGGSEALLGQSGRDICTAQALDVPLAARPPVGG